MRRTQAAWPDRFPDTDAARRWLAQVILPPSRRWAFVSTGKNASSSTLRFLFEAEFGTRLTTRYAPERDINPSAVVHALADSEVFARALHQGLDAGEIAALPGCERICVARNPHDRLASAFAYLCRSQTEEKAWFLGPRLRLDAAGFDWETMPGTAEGFRLFLRHVRAEMERLGPMGLDAHWRPQADFIQPEVFRPTLVGRVEDLDAFFAELAARLGAPPPEAGGRWENRQRAGEDPLARDPEARRLVEEIYAADFEAFGY